MSRMVSVPMALLAILLAATLALAAYGAPGAQPAGAPPTDEFIAGYASALLEREFGASAPMVRVSHGVITVRDTSLGDADPESARRVLSSIRGVEGVVIARAETDEPAAKKTSEEPADETTIILAKSKLFAPLLADPRWPHFSASYQRYIGNSELTDVASTSFGETFSLYRDNAPFGGRWDLGIQAGVFAIFDLDAESFDLINADYWVGLPLSYKYGDFSAIARFFHQSSHLGDEFILRGRASERINLSFEALDILGSYNLGVLEDLFGVPGDMARAFRIYLGGGRMIRHDPEDLKPLFTQWGAEYRSPTTWWDGRLRPIAAVDVQNREESGWNYDTSVRAGVQIEDPVRGGPRMQLLLEYYNGHSPNGQFFDELIQYIGLGLHFHYY